MTRPYDLAIVGGGTAGIIAAKTAGGLGARVVLIERDRPGGDSGRVLDRRSALAGPPEPAR